MYFNKKHLTLTIAGCMALTSFVACNNKEKESDTTQETSVGKPAEAKPAAPSADDALFEKGASGLESRWVTHGTGAAATEGSFAEIDVIFKVGDSMLANTPVQNGGKPVVQRIDKPSMQGDFMEGLAKMKAGDSAIFRMSLDTFSARTHQPSPPWARPGDYIRWEVKMHRIMTQSQMDAEEASKSKAQNESDDKILQAYFKSHNITGVKKTASGLYYTVSKAGSGAHPKAGQDVTVNYTGQKTNGEKFDSNVDPAFNHVQPFHFKLGARQVIRGWDEAVALMNPGMKATFYIPSSLAYGANGQGKIGPNEILIFDIELVSFK